LQVRPEEIRIVEARVAEVAAGEDGAGEIGVAKIAAGKIKAGEVLPGKDGPGAAHARRPEPVVAQADSVRLRLRKWSGTYSLVGRSGHEPRRSPIGGARPRQI